MGVVVGARGTGVVRAVSGVDVGTNGIVQSSGTGGAGAGTAGGSRRSRSVWRISCSEGRSSGSGDNASRSSRRTGSSMPDRSCSPRRTRSMIAIAGPLPYGGRPVAANTTVAAQACTSEAGVASSP